MTTPAANLGEIQHCFFCTSQKSAERISLKCSSQAALPLVTRGGYVVIWRRTNVSSWFLPCKMYKNRKIDLAITLLTPYPASSEAYLHKLNVAPSRLGLSWSWERTVAVACVQWNWDVQINYLIPSIPNNSLSPLFAAQNILAWYISSTYHEVFDYHIWFPFMAGLAGYNIF